MALHVVSKAHEHPNIMSAFAVVLIVIVLILTSLIVYRLIISRRASIKVSQKRFERIQELYNKLETGQNVSQKDIYGLAKNIQTRETTFQLLREKNLTQLFPQEFYTIEKAAESNLANWLEFPTELDAIPDEIEHVKRVTIDFDGRNNFVHYEVFKCRTNEPHWAAQDGWFWGVVGPYFDDSKPYDFPHCTFSRISSTVDKISPDDEAKWVHNNISNRKS